MQNYRKHAALTALTALTRNICVALLEAHAEIENLTSLHPIDEWHEDHGTVVWWSTDDDAVVIPDYIGSPLDSDWPSDDNYKWWSHLKISKGGP